MSDRPGPTSPEKAKRAPSGAARIALVAYFAVTGAFILSTAWQLTAAVFGLGAK